MNTDNLACVCHLLCLHENEHNVAFNAAQLLTNADVGDVRCCNGIVVSISSQCLKGEAPE